MATSETGCSIRSNGRWLLWLLLTAFLTFPAASFSLTTAHCYFAIVVAPLHGASPLRSRSVVCRFELCKTLMAWCGARWQLLCHSPYATFGTVPTWEVGTGVVCFKPDQALLCSRYVQLTRGDETCGLWRPELTDALSAVFLRLSILRHRSPGLCIVTCHMVIRFKHSTILRCVC